MADKLSPIYTTDYYRFKKLINTPEFKQDVKWLYKQYEKFKCPIPKGGFETLKRYEEWLQKVFETHDQIYKSSDPNIVAPLDFVYKQEILPPLPGKIVYALLKSYGFDPHNPRYQNFLSRFLFRGDTEYIEEPFHLMWDKEPKTRRNRLLIELFPYTKRDHIIDEWESYIKPQLEKIDNYKGKYKAWETFDRDLHIHFIYEKLKKQRKGKKLTNADKAVGKQTLDRETLIIVKKKYPALRIGEIEQARRRIRKLDKGVR